MHYPPYASLANVLVRSDKLNDAMKWSGLLGQWFESAPHEGVRVMGPAAAPIERLKNDYRYHFILKSKSRERLNIVLREMIQHAAQKKIPRTNVIVDVDALSLMLVPPSPSPSRTIVFSSLGCGKPANSSGRKS
jgi:primosomal protein N' (replication factor Y)